MIKVSELTGDALKSYLFRAEGMGCDGESLYAEDGERICFIEDWNPETDWAQGGPLVEKYKFDVTERSGKWDAYDGAKGRAWGHTPLQAVCRAVVRTAFGEEVEEIQP